MPNRDSLDKVIGTYFAALTTRPLTWAGVVHQPKTLHISPLIFRRYTCNLGCAGCCPRFSLDYIPGEVRPADTWIRNVDVNGVPFVVYSDRQTTNNSHFCKHVNMSTGACGIHGKQPFSCDFELLRVLHYETHSVMLTRLYGRGWNMLRNDGGRGALCEVHEPQDPDSIPDLMRRLTRLQGWLAYFKVDSKIARVMEYVSTGPHPRELVIE